jgi:hypothetical protein
MVKANQTSEMYVREDGEGNEQKTLVFIYLVSPYAGAPGKRY